MENLDHVLALVLVFSFCAFLLFCLAYARKDPL